MSGIIGSKLNHRGSGLVGSLGTDGQHLLSSGAGKTNVFESITAAESLAPLKHDVQTLALHSAIADNKAAYNLTSSFIDQFENDSGILTETNGDRNSTSEYWGTITTTAQSSTINFNNNGGIFTTGITSLLPTNNTNFTNEAWVYINSVSDMGTHEHIFFSANVDHYAINMGIVGQDSGAHGIIRRLFGNGSWQTYGNFSSPELAPATWHHVAYTKTASGVSFYINGVRVEENQTSAFSWSNTLMYFGRGVTASSHNLKGFGTEWRISDVARYTGSTFTVPTTALTNDSDTLLLVQSNTTDGSTTFTDGSSNTHSVSVDSSVEHSTDVTSPVSSTTASATGTLISNAQTANDATTKVSGIVLYKNEDGTATLNTDLTMEFSADDGSNWTASTMVSGGTFSTGILIAKCPEVTVTSGTQVKYRLVFANQSAGSKETQIHGVAITY